jgi:hypothetical protein
MSLNEKSTYHIIETLMEKAAKDVGIPITFKLAPVQEVKSDYGTLTAKGRTIEIILTPGCVAARDLKNKSLIWSSTKWPTLDAYGLQVQLESMLRSL